MHMEHCSRSSTPIDIDRRIKQKSTSRLAWIASLDINKLSFFDKHPFLPHSPSSPSILSLHRKTSIICTLGPKTSSIDAINKLRRSGMNIVRLNFSHGTHEEHAKIIDNVRQSSGQDEFGVEKPVAIALDTKGPEIRTASVSNSNGILIEEGQEITLSPIVTRTGSSLSSSSLSSPSSSSPNVITDFRNIYIDYENLGRTVTVGSLIYIDDGNLQLTVTEIINDSTVKARSLNSHRLLSKKGVNLPYARVDLPSISEKDKKDLEFAVKQGLDVIFASFIRHPQDIQTIRQLLISHDPKCSIPIIAKIENYEGVCNFDAILQEADGIMVARGDLGIEIPPEKVFVAQKMMISKCNLVGKPVICATQMLESMKNNPRPTRAEASDVANAVLDGSDCVMLSAETANGNYPIQSVEMMSRICVEAEGTIAYLPLFEELRGLMMDPGETNLTETISSCVVNASLENYITAIVVLTRTGDSAKRIAKYRPQVPIIAVTRFDQLARQLHLYRGIHPIHYSKPSPAQPFTQQEWIKDVEDRFKWAAEEGKKMGLLKSGDYVVTIQGSREGHGFTNTMKIERVI